MNTSPDLFVPLLGLCVFNAKKGHGSFVTFGLTTTPAAPTEEFYFWVYMCDWRIRESNIDLAHCESSDGDITSAVSKLNGKILKEIVLETFITSEGLYYGALLIFEGRITMKLQQYEDSSPSTAIFKTRNATRMWVSYLTDGSIKT